MPGLLPREEGFFDFFDRASANLHQGATLLDELTANFSDIENRARQITNVEHAGDHLTREAIEMLNRTFITPFDRDEIYTLVCRMDDVLDLIENVSNRLMLYRVPQPTEDAKRLVRILVTCTRILAETTPMLRSIKKPAQILANCLDVHTQESEADRVEQHGIATLFERNKEPIEVIKWKDIYEDLEQATDRCADVANAIESIVIRNG